MNMPGFNAEDSRYKISGDYRQAIFWNNYSNSHVIPAICRCALDPEGTCPGGGRVDCDGRLGGCCTLTSPHPKPPCYTVCCPLGLIPGCVQVP